MGFYSKEISFMPYSTFLTCPSCFKSFDSSLLSFHNKACFRFSENPTYEYQQESKKQINQKLSCRLRKLEILKNLLKSIQNSHPDSQSSIFSQTTAKITKLIEKSSKIMKSTFFT